LQGKQELLVSLPIFLISIPVVNSVAGNIGSVLGARLASGLHVGYITHSFNDKEMHNNLVVSLLIGFFTYFILAIIIYLVAIFSKIAEDIALLEFVSIIVVTGFLLICVVAVISVLTAFISFRRGLDPDDMVAPVVTTVGDIMGIVFLFVVLGIFGVGI
jgi:mgtE-like transporter